MDDESVIDPQQQTPGVVPDMGDHVIGRDPRGDYLRSRKFRQIFRKISDGSNPKIIRALRDLSGTQQLQH
ncbi:MAG: hypothetical protein F4190_05670 [Acidimicrobiales bacterium]|nr:hypothetical protein [Acidimicrobiales bacterium]MYG88001.1 hypothetical protein [Acidimicrobiales bacterium]MYI28374.1 hypothetical protein [Acidimicrobiales bacterium]